MSPIRVPTQGNGFLQRKHSHPLPRKNTPALETNLAKFWVNIASFYNTFVTGIAFTGAGWKYYFLFVCWDALEFACIYFFFVETKQRTLEELTEIFRAKKPVQYSLRKTGAVVHDGEITEVLNKESA